MDAKLGAYAVLGILVIAAIAVIAFNSPIFSSFSIFSKNSVQKTVSPVVVAPTEDPGYVSSGVDAGEVLPTQYALRQQYFEEVFKPHRDQYHLFEKAAQHLGIPIGQVPAYFSLKSESDIFSELPPIPTDFSEISYLLANGKYFSIGYLDEGYWMQPEFYPGFKRSALRYWTEADPKYWGVVGVGSYPAVQADELEIGGRETFDAVLFVYSGFGVQTYQGIHLQPSSEALKYFDIQIEEPNFLLDPTFSKFGKNWVKRVVIHGKRKAETPAGKYNIDIFVEKPPKELIARWEADHRNLYYNAQGALTAGGVLSMDITLKEKGAP